MSRMRTCAQLVFIMLCLCIVSVNVAQTQSDEGQILIVAPDGAYSSITEAMEHAQAGDTIEVHGGIYPAPLIIETSVHLVGKDNPVIDGEGNGSLVVIRAPDTHFEGFTVRNSGESLNREDTGIVIQAKNVTVQNNDVEDVLFGIYFANASDGLAQNNKVRCYPRDIGIRGDGMRIWFSSDVILDGNDVRDCRDTLVWYAQDVIIKNNLFQDSRYGLHFMYSSNAHIENNTFQTNSVGTYLMYSQHLTMIGNRMIGNRGPSGYGIALKEIDYATIEDNILLDNRSGVYIDNSPALVDVSNTYTNNLLAYNGVGVSALPSTARNIFAGNIFLENHQQISVLGRGNLLNNTWNGNYWSDYIGYDGDDDGIGDIDYRAEKLFESLTDEYPEVKLFTYSPASQAIEFAASAFPSLRPDPKVIDSAPMMSYTLPAPLTESAPGFPVSFLMASLLLASIGASICLYALRAFRIKQQRLSGLKPSPVSS